MTNPKHLSLHLDRTRIPDPDAFDSASMDRIFASTSFRRQRRDAEAKFIEVVAGAFVLSRRALRYPETLQAVVGVGNSGLTCFRTLAYISVVLPRFNVIAIITPARTVSQVKKRDGNWKLTDGGVPRI